MLFIALTAFFVCVSSHLLYSTKDKTYSGVSYNNVLISNHARQNVV